jgi:Bacterial antitoxin of type II TA system, VapB
MATNLAIDDELPGQALQIGGQKTKKATVMEALREYIQRRQQAAIVSLFGTIDIDAEYDHEQQQRRRR